MSAIQDQVDLRDAIDEARASGDDERAAEAALRYAWNNWHLAYADWQSWADPERPKERRSPARLAEAKAALDEAEETRARCHARWLACLNARWEAERIGQLSLFGGRNDCG